MHYNNSNEDLRMSFPKEGEIDVAQHWKVRFQTSNIDLSTPNLSHKIKSVEKRPLVEWKSEK